MLLQCSKDGRVSEELARQAIGITEGFVYKKIKWDARHGESQDFVQYVMEQFCKNLEYFANKVDRPATMFTIFVRTRYLNYIKREDNLNMKDARLLEIANYRTRWEIREE